jgi:hypothetical protein
MLDVIEEAKREELKAKCREMKVLPPTDIFIGLQVHDKGKLIFDDVQRGHSWTRNYWNYIFGKTSNCGLSTTDFGAGYISCKGTTGDLSASNWPIAYIHGNIMTASANVVGGIVVGTGTAAFDIEQYALDALVSSGSSAGKLYYNASAVSSTTYAAKKWTIVGSRIFNNNSGGSIVVAETGIYAPYGSLFWLFERSLLSPTVTVPDAAQLTVTYTIVDDFSSID